LPRAKAATTPLACSENNNNGCTELSSTPPQDTVAVPPNLVLMLDDSGSMAADYMPDFGYLKNNSNNAALINAANNGVYYDPTATYTPPPKADSTTAAPDTYPAQTDMTSVLQDGFGIITTNTVNLFTYDGGYECNDSGNCSGSGGIAFNTSVENASAPAQTYDAIVNSQKNGKNTTYADQVCQNLYSSHSTASNYQFIGQNKDKNGNWTSGECKFTYHAAFFFQYSTSPSTTTYPNGDPSGPYTVHYIAASTTDCASAPTPTTCVAASDTSGAAAPKFKADGITKLTAGENVANWFAYYHTRILMAKSGLMTAFNNLPADYRFGFASINARGVGNIPASPTPYGFDDSTSGGGSSNNKLAVVQPFGDGSTGTQKAAFWKWIANESAGNNTPLRKALQGVGNYYKTQQPWTTMSSDPGYTTGSTTKYACRASYAILTTDGFWNGQDPGIGNVSDQNGPTYTPPAGKTYTVTGYVAAQPFSNSNSPPQSSNTGSFTTLADVAMYYWENDLQDGSGSSFNLANEVAPSAADPAFWQHMTTFTMGLGFSPKGINGTASNGDNPPTIQDIFNWAQDLDGAATSPRTITGFSWPTPSSGTINNIADLAHAGVNGHGDFFSAKSPQALAAGFSSAIATIGERNVPPTTAAVNASVITAGALSFSTGYDTSKWYGALEGVTLRSDGTTDTVQWLDGKDPLHAALVSTLDSDYHTATGYSGRKVYTDAYALTTDASGNVTSATFNKGFQFTSANSATLDSIQTAGLESPALSTTNTNDTLEHRINFLLGDPTYEDGTYRSRVTLLGAIIRSQPVYVSYASSGYYDNWPNKADGTAAPEAGATAQTYDAFVTQESTRPGTLYVGANDGMLHAFAAPAPTGCAADGTGCDYGDGGTERWAFIPRAVYANLGNLTSPSFSYRPTVDETPVTRDVFFSDNKWHTILAGGVGLGGRGVYALNITDPTSFSASNVLWEFDSDMTIPSGAAGDCVASYGDCRASDLGYTVSQPNIGRLHNGQWAVLVSNGYFPDCGTPDTPTNDTAHCQAIAAQAPKDTSGNPYSALFVLNAETGSVIAELKTPTGLGVTSFGLATPVMGDYDNDQIDDVAFAGDVQGNLWRFDMQDSKPANWTVTLVYKGLADASGNQGAQPITSMPRLFPDPATNRFMVVFGTGKFLGLGDNSDSTVQAIMGVRDDGKTHSQNANDMTQQYLHETTVSTTLPDGTPNPDPNAGATLRCVTGKSTDTCSTSAAAANPIPSSGTGSGGWFINLYAAASDGTQTDAGERVVVSPGAIFASNTVVFETLITGSVNSDPCSPSTKGAIMVLDAGTGGAAGVSSLGGWPFVGGRISNARTSGSLPLVSALGGGQAYLPGTTLAPSGNPLSIDAPIWRRRSWQGIQQN